MNATKKRKLDSDPPSEREKRLKMTAQPGPSAQGTTHRRRHPLPPRPQPPPAAESGPLNPPEDALPSQPKDKGKQKADSHPIDKESHKEQTRRRINKLNAPRPFPTVPTSVNATGPRSSHREGTNMICITRKSSLSSYMRRCKDVIVQEGYKTLNLSAMGAAIPLLLQLVCALPPILPFPQDEIQWQVTTGTTEVQDEVIPDDEDEDISYQTRCKSTLGVIFKIGNGEHDGNRGAIRKYSAGKSVAKGHHPRKNDTKKTDKGKGKSKEDAVQLVYEEPEQEFMDML